MPCKSKVSSSGENIPPLPTEVSSKALAVIFGIASTSLTFIKEKPSSHEAWKVRFYFIRKIGWSIPVAPSSSLSALPTLDLRGLKKEMQEVGLIKHGFNAKGILEKELLIVAGLHPTLDPYDGPEDHFTRFQSMMNRTAVLQVHSRRCPDHPLGDHISFGHSLRSSVFVYSSFSHSPPQSYSSLFLQGTVVIDVVTFLEHEGTPFQTSSRCIPLLLFLPPSKPYRLRTNNLVLMKLESRVHLQLGSFQIP
ncbi:hypothetical protein Salat_1666500 [Sesamum alatum]|uniref:Uncharacterized protein n=1 Tax=Sesamum alatum TaxID=300844 RepID=A0AAE2CJZ4_9LAMI|nr:hypothetical protein Salat_1666500 [Sesamum alatum]